jgi:hypothetical protein
MGHIRQMGQPGVGHFLQGASKSKLASWLGSLQVFVLQAFFEYLLRTKHGA